MNESFDIQKAKEAIQFCITHGYVPDGFSEKLPNDYRGEPLAVVIRQDVINMLYRYLRGEWDNDDVGDWCAGMHNCYGSYVIFEAGYAADIDNVVSQWHAFYDSLTPELAQKEIEELQNAPYDPEDIVP